MSSQVAIETTKEPRPTDKHQVSPNNHDDRGANSQHQIENLRILADNRLTSDETRKNESTKDDLKPEDSEPFRTPRRKSAAKEVSSDYFTNPLVAKPLLLSPTGTDSTASSPSASSDVWDSPRTPYSQLGRTLRNEDLTPLTPLMRPTEYGSGLEESPSIKRHIPPRNVATPTAKLAASTPSRILNTCFVEDEQKDKVKNEDDPQPRVLFPDLNDMIKASKAENAAYTTFFNTEPDFVFSDNEGVSKTRKLRSKAKQGIRAKSENPVVEVKTESTGMKLVPNNFQQSQPLPLFIQTVLEFIVPLDIHARLEETPRKCVASLVKGKGERCTKPASSLHGVEEILRLISRHHKEIDHIAFLDQIKKLVQAVMCTQHQKVALVGPKSNPRMKRLREILLDLKGLEADRKAFELWANAISDKNVSLDAYTASNVMKSPVTPSITPSSNGFTPYQPKRYRNISVSDALRKKITEKLGKEDQKDGYIYVFWDHENFGMVKIGRTNNLNRRLEEWNTSCDQKYSYHAATKDGALTKIPHVNRVEKLMQIELKDVRMQRKCEGCGKNHIEWFSVREPQAVQIFKKWQNWIEQRPYEVGDGSLRVEMLDSLAEVCKPVQFESASKPQPRRESKPKKQNRRRSGRMTI